MVAVSPEIDDDDLRIREGLLDETLDFNSVHSHRDTLQRSVAAAMQAPNQLAKYRPRPRGWAAAIETPEPRSNLQDLSQNGAPTAVRFPTYRTPPVGDATYSPPTSPLRL